jgi:hypothetical protein
VIYIHGQSVLWAGCHGQPVLLTLYGIVDFVRGIYFEQYFHVRSVLRAGGSWKFSPFYPALRLLTFVREIWEQGLFHGQSTGYQRTMVGTVVVMATLHALSRA